MLSYTEASSILKLQLPLGLFVTLFQLIWPQDKVTFSNENSKSVEIVRYVSKPGTASLNEVAAYSRDRLREREEISSCIRVRTLTMSRATRFFFLLGDCTKFRQAFANYLLQAIGKLAVTRHGFRIERKQWDHRLYLNRPPPPDPFYIIF